MESPALGGSTTKPWLNMVRYACIAEGAKCIFMHYAMLMKALFASLVQTGRNHILSSCKIIHELSYSTVTLGITEFRLLQLTKWNIKWKRRWRVQWTVKRYAGRLWWLTVICCLKFSNLHLYLYTHLYATRHGSPLNYTDIWGGEWAHTRPKRAFIFIIINVGH